VGVVRKGPQKSQNITPKPGHKNLKRPNGAVKKNTFSRVEPGGKASRQSHGVEGGKRNRESPSCSRGNERRPNGRNLKLKYREKNGMGEGQGSLFKPCHPKKKKKNRGTKKKIREKKKKEKKADNSSRKPHRTREKAAVL